MKPSRSRGTCRSTHGPREGAAKRKKKKKKQIPPAATAAGIQSNRRRRARRRDGASLVGGLTLACSPRRGLLTAPLPGSPGARWGRAAEGRAARGGRLVSSGNGQRARKSARPWPPFLAFGGIDTGQGQGRSGGAFGSFSIAPDEPTETEAARATAVRPRKQRRGIPARPCARGPGLWGYGRERLDCFWEVAAVRVAALVRRVFGPGSR
jgi:hypothetical protein